MSTLYTYATILAEVQQACIQLNLGKPIGVYDSQDENAILMGSYANLIGPMLSETEMWQQFNSDFSITGDGSNANFDLPADFSRFIDDTGWSDTNRRPVIILNDQQWASIKAWVSQSFFVNPACIINNDQLQFVVPPGLNEIITFNYVSKFWVIDGLNSNVKKEMLTQNSDIPMHDSILFTIALKLKWQQIRGLPTAMVQGEFDDRIMQLLSRNQMAQTLTLNGGTTFGFRYLDNWYNPGDTGYGS